MFKNYLKTIFRNLRKNKTFTAINIAGLSIGMAACLLILQYVSFELSYDQFNENAKDIYRVANDRYQNGKLMQHGTITYSAVGPDMQTDFPEVINHVRVVPVGEVIITYKDKKLEESNAMAAETSLFTMFNFPLLAGDVKTVLNEPNSVVLSTKLAERIFDYKGTDYNSLIGKTFVISRDSLPYKVTGICKNLPENSHLQFDIAIAYPTLYRTYGWKEAEHDYKDSDFWHYIQLKQGTNYKALEAKLPAFSQRHFQGNKISGSDEKFFLQPLSKAHLYSDFEYEIGRTASATVVWGLLIIALFIISIAWVNYINLSTARSADRAKEVGVRKVAGATKSQLVRQFLGESLFINIISLVIAVGFVLLVQRSFNSLTGYDLSLSYLFRKGLNGYAISIALIVLIIAGILISGFYPAFVLSSFKPILVLKGKFSASKKGIALRKSLVIGQFAITVALIIGSFVVYKQLKYVNSQQLGMNIDQMLMIKGPSLTKQDSTFSSTQESFKEEIKRIPNVKAVTTTDRPLGNEMARVFDVRRTDATDANMKFTLRRFGVGHEFLAAYNIKLSAGRDFAFTDYNGDWQKIHNIILNKSAVKLLGFKSDEDAVGKTVRFFDKNWDIIGVANDFHQKSLHYAIEPLIMHPSSGVYSPISVKVSSANINATIAAIKAKYDAFFQGNLFDYFFLDEKFNDQYKNDQLFGKVFGIFASLAIFVACLGLLGLSLFATIQRTKEIGVRKVLGASISDIVVLISKDFILLVVIALVIASPIAWFIMNRWLQDFVYRINISWWLFLLAGSLAVFIALATISYQAIKAAMTNPVKSLRAE
ncbi:MAG: ABC transporter permease [Bacteroidetes bacterium]|nr:ABC transporter permease [Bacteroidota bacterium]